MFSKLENFNLGFKISMLLAGVAYALPSYAVWEDEEVLSTIISQGVGFSIPSAMNDKQFTQSLALQFSVGYRFDPHFSAGAFFQTAGTYTHDRNLAGGTKEITELQNYNVGGEFTGHFWPLDPDFMLFGGVKLGVARQSVEVFSTGVKTSSDSRTGIMFGPKGGFDYLFNSGLSLGIEANWILLTKTHVNGGYNSFNLMFMARYWCDLF